MKRLVIAIDCDDVLVSATEYVVRTYNEKYGTRVMLRNAHQSRNAQWEAERHEVFARLHDIQRTKEYGAIAPSQETIEAIRDLAERHELHVVTARSPEIEAVTQLMIDTCFQSMFASIEHVGPDRPKGEVCAEIHADVLIDDNLHNLEGAKDNGIQNLIMFGSYSWQVSQGIVLPGLIECSDWGKVKEEIERIANR